MKAHLMGLGMRKLLRQLKRKGQTAEEVLKQLVNGRMEAYKSQGWKMSELAAALADDWENMEIVFGKKTMAKIDRKAKAVVEDKKQEERP